MFLASCFESLIAVDGSKIAVNECKKKSLDKGIENIDFIHSLIDDPKLLDILFEKLTSLNKEKKSIYTQDFFYILFLKKMKIKSSI